MHMSKADLEPTVIGGYEGRSVDAAGIRAGDAYHLRPGHSVQTLDPVQLLELSPVEEHDRTSATLARNMGAAITGCATP